METSIQEHEHAGIEVVSARLNYLAEATPKPVNFAYDPPAGVPRRSGKYVERSVVIHNGREMLNELSLDTNGFVLTQHETAVNDFYDPEEVKSVYYPEVERLMKRVTGAERVLVFDHIVRNPVLAERGEKGARSPAKKFTTTTASNPRRAASATICRRRQNTCSRIASPRSTSGARFAARSKVRRWHSATLAAWTSKIACRPISSIAIASAKLSASSTTPGIAGTTSRGCNVTKQSC